MSTARPERSSTGRTAAPEMKPFCGARVWKTWSYFCLSAGVMVQSDGAGAAGASKGPGICCWYGGGAAAGTGMGAGTGAGAGA
eukprot:779257-Prymnesium_polylepis.1